MRTVRTFTVSLLIAIGGALGVLGAVAAVSPAANDTGVTVVAGGEGGDDTHW